MYFDWELHQFCDSPSCSLFFYLILEGIMVKVSREHFLFRLFLLIWEEKICGLGRENFLPDFPSSLFSLVCQIVENTVFPYIFLLMFSILPKFTPTKHSVTFNQREEKERTEIWKDKKYKSIKYKKKKKKKKKERKVKEDLLARRSQTGKEEGKLAKKKAKNWNSGSTSTKAKSPTKTERARERESPAWETLCGRLVVWHINKISDFSIF